MPKLSAAVLVLAVLFTIVGTPIFGWGPCPICYIQRGLYLLLAFFYWMWSKTNSKIYKLSTFGLTTIGLGVSAWHIHLLHNPSFSCGASFTTLAESLGLLNALREVLSVECSFANAYVFGIEFPYLAIAGYLVALGIALFRKSGPPRSYP